MSDPRDDEPVRHETTIIQTGERRGGGGTIVALVVLLVLGLFAFLFFGGYLRRAADRTDVNVNVAAPNIELPDVQITPPATEPANKSGN
ncbi:hypothetical protein [Sphingosinicella sp.]|uniref:hypothetical protein n=1 Tax=Sphingosinicella sp. TaxID=1917971 RepID=UPI004037E317